MKEIEVVLTNKLGLHARPAAMFVREASKYSSEIMIVKDSMEYNGKSVIGVLSMGAPKGTKLIIKAKGEDEKEAIQALKELIESNFDELE